MTAEKEVEIPDGSLRFLPKFSHQRKLVEKVFGQDFLSEKMTEALNYPEKREILLKEKLAEIKEAVTEINYRLSTGSSGINKVFYEANEVFFERICAALDVIGVFIHQIARFGSLDSEALFDFDACKFKLTLGTVSSGERIFISWDRIKRGFRNGLSFPASETLNCRNLQGGFKRLFVKERILIGLGSEPVESADDRVADLFLVFS